MVSSRIRLRLRWIPLLLVVVACSAPGRQDRDWPLLSDGTPVEVSLYTNTDQDASAVFDDMRGSMEAFAASVLDGTDRGNLGRLNAAAEADYVPVDDLDLYRCVLLGLDYAKVSEGAFDPTVGPLLGLWGRQAARGGPAKAAIEDVLRSVGWQKVAVASEAHAIRFRRPGMKLDLGGVAKGFALDVGARAFARPGCVAGLLVLGGNAYAWNAPPGEATWRVDLPDPADPSRTLLAVGAVNQGVAVSGRHLVPDPDVPPAPDFAILDPRNGRPVAGDVIAAVALADSAGDADALATALYVSGSLQGAALLERMRRVEAVLVVEGREGAVYVLASGSLRERLWLSEDLERTTGGDVRYLLPGHDPRTDLP